LSSSRHSVSSAPLRAFASSPSAGGRPRRVRRHSPYPP
jgi:hypothetical protein